MPTDVQPQRWAGTAIEFRAIASRIGWNSPAKGMSAVFTTTHIGRRSVWPSVFCSSGVERRHEPIPTGLNLSPSRDSITKTATMPAAAARSALSTFTTGEHEHEVRLLLRRQDGRRQRQDEGTARRQGGQPRRDVHDRHPRPPGFTITTEVCAAYYEHGKKIPEAAIPQIDEARQEGRGRVRRQEVRRPGRPAARLASAPAPRCRCRA